MRPARALDDAAHVSIEANLAGDLAAVALVQTAWSGGHFVLPAEGLGPLPSALAVAGVDLSSVNVGSVQPEATCLVLAVPSADVAKAVRAIEQAMPGARGVVVLDAGTRTMHATSWQAPAESTVPSRRGREAIVVAGRSPSATDADSALPRPVAVLAAELVARGASTRRSQRRFSARRACRGRRHTRPRWSWLVRRNPTPSAGALHHDRLRFEPRTSRRPHVV